MDIVISKWFNKNMDSEKFNPLTFHRQEREIEDCMSQRFPEHWETIDGKQTSIVEFPDFKISSHQELGQPAKQLKIIAGEKEYDLIAMLPTDHQLFLTHNPSAIYKHILKQLHIPHIRSRGALLSALHEFSHVAQYLTYTEQERIELNDARRAIPEGVNAQQRSFIISDEQQAWEGARLQGSKITEALGAEIFPGEKDLEDYIARRIETYEKYT